MSFPKFYLPSMTVLVAMQVAILAQALGSRFGLPFIIYDSIMLGLTLGTVLTTVLYWRRYE